MISTSVKYRDNGGVVYSGNALDSSAVITELLDEESFYVNIHNRDVDAVVGIATNTTVDDPGTLGISLSKFQSLGIGPSTSYSWFARHGALDSYNGIVVAGAEFHDNTRGAVRIMGAVDITDSASSPFTNGAAFHAYGWEKVIEGENQGDYFGSAVACKHNRIVIGARLATVSNSGKVYIMDIRGDIVKTLEESGTLNYGTAVAIGCGRILVGASATTVNGQSSFGCVYMYDMDGNFIRKIVPTSGGSSGDLFGDDVAIGDGRIVVGARWANSEDGAIYIFDLNGKQLQKINSPDGTGSGDGTNGTGADYGCAISIGDGRIVVGSAYTKLPPGRYIGGYTTRVAASKGIVYIYDLDGNLLKKIAMATDSDHSSYKSTSYSYGYSVNVTNGRIFVGDPDTEDTYLSTTLDSRGALYMYDLDGNLLKRYVVREETSGNFNDNYALYGSGTTMAYYRTNGIFSTKLITGIQGIDYDTNTPDPWNNELQGYVVEQYTDYTNSNPYNGLPLVDISPLSQTHYLESMELA